MIAQSRFLVVVEGPIDRILGSHRTTDVSITEHTSSRPGTAGGAHQTETHIFVHTSREFAMLLEVKGRTLKLVNDYYIAAAEGDDVRALCEPTHNGPLVVKDWHNRTRSIRFRHVPRPLYAPQPSFSGPSSCCSRASASSWAFRQKPMPFSRPLSGRAPGRSRDPSRGGGTQSQWLRARPR